MRRTGGNGSDNSRSSSTSNSRVNERTQLKERRPKRSRGSGCSVRTCCSSTERACHRNCTALHRAEECKGLVHNPKQQGAVAGWGQRWRSLSKVLVRKRICKAKLSDGPNASHLHDWESTLRAEVEAGARAFPVNGQTVGAGVLKSRTQADAPGAFLIV
jgi:hypothetical protein